jgi:hypothetical protein
MNEETKTISKREFEALEPFERGYVSYTLGGREDQPNIPDEDNPYMKGSKEYKAWERGAWQAYLAALDGLG